MYAKRYNSQVQDIVNNKLFVPSDELMSHRCHGEGVLDTQKQNLTCFFSIMVVGPSLTCLSMCTSMYLFTWQYPCRTMCHSLHYCPDNHRSTHESLIWTVWVHWADNVFLLVPNPPWYMKRWPSDIGVIEGTYLHPYIYISGLSHLVPYLQRAETAANCAMTRRLMRLQPPWTAMIALSPTGQSSLQFRSRRQFSTTMFFPLSTIKTPLKQNLGTQHQMTLTSSFLSKGSYPFCV